MKAVFISDVNPGRGHIWGLRVASFARAMARRGHRIILLSPSDSDERSLTGPEQLAVKLATQDWSIPLAMTANPVAHLVHSAARSPGMPGALRRLMTGYLLAMEGGVHNNWELGVRQLATAIADQFQPDVVWSIFGNASTLVVAQKMARRASCPWVMDIKDNWESYTPSLLRPIIRWRFADAAGFTTNAEVHGDIASRWLPHRKVVLYSGVAEAMIAAPNSKARGDKFVLSLIGSVYREEMLAQFIAALGAWVSTLADEDRKRILLHYAGVADMVVRNVTHHTPPGCEVRIDHNLPHAELAKLCQSAAANCYLWLPHTFHHKMLELLTTRRPAISFPGEHAESILIAQKVNGELIACSDGAELTAAFEAIWRRWKARDLSGTQVDARAVTWDANAAILEAFLESAIHGRRNEVAA